MNSIFMRNGLALVLGLTCTLANAEMYKINVKRTEQDLYIDRSNNILIHTRYCYVYSYGDDAILIYEPYSYDNKIVFDDGTSCEVKSVSSFK